MSQANLFNYYQVCKKQQVDTKELKGSEQIRSTNSGTFLSPQKPPPCPEAEQSPFKVPTTPVPRRRSSITSSSLSKSNTTTSCSSSIKSRSSTKSGSRARSRSSTKLASFTKQQSSILKWAKQTTSPLSINEKTEQTAETSIEKLIKCDESIERNAERYELIGGCSNLSALRQRRQAENEEKPVKNESSASASLVPPSSPTKSEQVASRKLAFGRCSNLTELREKLAGADRSFIDKLKDFHRKTASPVKLPLSVVSSPSKRPPADAGDYSTRLSKISQSPKKFLEEICNNSPVKIRPADLDRTNRPGEGLTLPYKYRTLMDAFFCFDSVVAMIFNRQETCTFEKVRSGIQKITKKNFELKHLQQILFIFPNSYAPKWDRKNAIDVNNTISQENGSRNSFNLVLLPGVNHVKMSPSILKVRKNEFEEKLLQFTKDEHQKYLRSLQPPVEISPELLRKWHPCFRFPEIPEASLPPLPANANTANSAGVQQFLNQTSSIQQKQQQEAEERRKAAEAMTDAAREKEASKKKITQGPLRGLSLGFLEKIKNKEAALLAKEITRKPEEERKLSMIKQLPPLIRILHSYFVVEKKAAIPIEQVVKKCTENSTSLSVGNCNDYLYLLNELLPDWLFILKVSKGTFIKIDKGKVLDTLFTRLDNIAKRMISS